MKLVVLWLAIGAACHAPVTHHAIGDPSPPSDFPWPDPQPARDRSGHIRPEATAGPYWIPYRTCYDCGEPAAVVAYLTTDPTMAQSIVDRLRPNAPLGMPWVIHTDELAVAGGIAVVVGTFAAAPAARELAARAPRIAGISPVALELNHGDELTTSLTKRITVVDRGPAVVAWAAGDLEAALERVSEPPSYRNEAERKQSTERALARLTPACVVRAGSLFVVDESEFQWNEFAPVRCGQRRAYIRWTASLLGHAVIVRDGDRYRLSQVVGAQCDRAIVEDWRYDADGRHREADEGPQADALVAIGGC